MTIKYFSIENGVPIEQEEYKVGDHITVESNPFCEKELAIFPNPNTDETDVVGIIKLIVKAGGEVLQSYPLDELHRIHKICQNIGEQNIVRGIVAYEPSPQHERMIE